MTRCKTYRPDTQSAIAHLTVVRFEQQGVGLVRGGQPGQECSEQIALEGHDLPCTYLAHHELKSVITLTVVIVIDQDRAGKIKTGNGNNRP